MSAGNGLSAGVQSRVAARFRVDALTYIDLGPNNGGMVTGVGESGLSFQGVQPLEDGQQLAIRFRLPGTKQVLSAAGRIVWLNSSGKGGGLQFFEMPNESRGLLRNWLARRDLPEVPREAPPHHLSDPDESLETYPTEHPEDPAEGAPELSRAAVPERPAEVKSDISFSADDTLKGAFSLGRGHLPGRAGSPLRASLANSPSNSPLLASVRKFPSPLPQPDLPVSGTTQREPREASKLISWLLVGAASLAIFGTTSFFVLHARSASYVKVLSQSGDNSLGLKLERQGTDWQVSWNRNADSVLKAIGGHLSITDGQSRKDLDLEPSELRGGSILYTPLSNDVFVRLQIVGGNSDVPVSESVRILAGGATPGPPDKLDKLGKFDKLDKPGDRPSLGHTDSTVKGTSSANSSASAGSGPAPRELIALDLRTPRRPGWTATPSASHESGSRDFVAPDNEEPPSASAPEAMGLGLHSSPAPLQPVPESNVHASAAGMSRVVQAQLISGRDPVFPASARGIRISGSATVHFRIGKDGRVSDATLTKGNPLFGRAAIEAVMARQYRPATVAGVAVDSESDAVFVFNPR